MTEKRQRAKAPVPPPAGERPGPRVKAGSPGSPDASAAAPVAPKKTAAAKR